MERSTTERAWRYHAKYEPKIFVGNEIDIAEEAGWVDSPAKVESIDSTPSQDASASRQDTDEEIALGFQIPENLVDLSVKKLKKLCKHRELTGYSNLNEAGLIALLEGK